MGGRIGVSDRLEGALPGFAGRDVPPLDGDRSSGRRGFGDRRSGAAGGGRRWRNRGRAWVRTGTECERRGRDEDRDSLTGSHVPSLLCWTIHSERWGLLVVTVSSSMGIEPAPPGGGTGGTGSAISAFVADCPTCCGAAWASSRSKVAR